MAYAVAVLLRRQLTCSKRPIVSRFGENVRLSSYVS